jgi:putative copper resistance protein D
MTGHSMYPHILIQWINFLGIFLLVGGVVFRWMVLNRSLNIFSHGSSEKTAIKTASARYLKKIVGVCVILLVIVSTADLILRAQMMSGKPLSGVPAILPLVLMKTHLGKVWIGKMAFLFLFGVLWFFINENLSSAVQLLLVLASAGFCLTMSLSGHPADRGDFTFPVLADWLHIMAVSAWAGGLIPLRFLLPKLLTMFDDKNRLKFETEALHRFSQLAGVCVGILAISGFYSAWFRLRTLSNLFGTPYGNALLRKLVFVAVVIGLGGLSRYYCLPCFQKMAGESRKDSLLVRLTSRVVRILGVKGHEDFETVQMHFRRFLIIEFFLVVVVLALTAFLTQTSPPDLTNFNAPGSPSEMEHMM